MKNRVLRFLSFLFSASLVFPLLTFSSPVSLAAEKAVYLKKGGAGEKTDLRRITLFPL